MSMTVRELLAEDALHLQLVVLGNSVNLERSIYWVHITEVVDSTEFCEPGEILLTIGLGMPQIEDHSAQAVANADPQEMARFNRMCDAFVTGMVDAGVLACGFGVGMRHPTVPRALIEAASRHGLPLFEIPIETTFQDISRTVSQSIADEGHCFLRDSYSLQRTFIAAAKSPDPIHATVIDVADSIGGWAAFVTPAGEVWDVSHSGARGIARTVALTYRALHQLGDDNLAPSHASVFDHEGSLCCAAELHDASQRPLGLMLGVAPEQGTDEMAVRTAVMNAADVLSVTVAQAMLRQIQLRSLRATVMRGMANGLGRGLSDVAAELWGPLPHAPVAVLCVDGEAEDLTRLYEAQALSAGLDGIEGIGGISRISGMADPRSDPSDATMARTPQATQGPQVAQRPDDGSVLFGDFDNKLWFLVSQNEGAGLRERIKAAAQRLGIQRCGIGMTTATSWETLRSAYAEARLDLQMSAMPLSAGGPGGGAIADLDIMHLIAPRVAESFCQAFLRPLLEDGHGATGTTRHTLLHTASSFVISSFNITTTAQRLGVHRHTVENRLARIEQLLGVDLANAHDLMRLYLAIEEYTRSHPDSPTA